jgi:hypothetical protein
MNCIIGIIIFFALIALLLIASALLEKRHAAGKLPSSKKPHYRSLLSGNPSASPKKSAPLRDAHGHFISAKKLNKKNSAKQHWGHK